MSEKDIMFFIELVNAEYRKEEMEIEQMKNQAKKFRKRRH